MCRALEGWNSTDLASYPKQDCVFLHRFTGTGRISSTVNGNGTGETRINGALQPGFPQVLSARAIAASL